MTGRIALVARAHLAWRPVTLVALLSLTLAAALTQGLRALESRSTAVPAAGTHKVTGAAGASLGPAARASISASIGAQDSAYHFNAVSGGGLRARNPAQRLHIGVGAAGLQIQQPGLELGLRVRALGYGRSLQPVSAVRPTAAANHASYAHAGLSEWYVNGPLGVEQGFTLAHAPARHAAGALTVAIALSGDTRATLAPAGQSVTFTAANGRSVRYSGLSVSDAGGHPLHSWLALGGGQLLLQVAAAHARFPLHIDPLLEAESPGARLQPVKGKGESEESEERGEVGLGVAISADGDTALVGAPGGKGSGGAVWVFAWTGGAWVQQQRLEAPEIEGGADVCAEAVAGEEDEECRFGGAVALSGNGDEALIGAPRANSDQGAAWIFTRDGSSGFTPSAELTSPEPVAAGHFGRSVALSYSGETALVGAPGELKSNGRAWVFTGAGPSWAVSAPLAGAGEQGAGHLGRSVALSGNGEVALVGAPVDDAGVGAAWVFGRAGAVWLEQGPELTITGSDEERQEARFGHSVALDEEGNVALVGANDYKGGQGAVWTFSRSGGEWSEQAPKLEGASASVEELGNSLALSASGDTAVLGAPNYQELRGAAWLYVRTGSAWGSPLRRLERGSLSHQRKSRFGYSVSISADAETVLVGGPTEQNKEGAAWVFDHAPKVKSVEPNTGSTLGGTYVTIIGRNFSEATAVRFGGVEALSFSVNPGEHSITAESPPGNPGTVDITVTTPLGTSAASVEDQFTYMTPGHKSGKGGGGGSGGGGSSNGGEEPHSTGTPGSPQSTGATTAPLGAEAVLALGPVSSAACGALLLSKQIAVEHNDHALFKLLGTGTGKCAGKLRLRIEIKLANKHLKLKTIGVAVFSIASGKRVSVSVKLNAVGRALLKSGRGRLTGNLLLVKQSPVPFVSHTASVRLALQRPKSKHKA
jgi:hypothetical protein